MQTGVHHTYAVFWGSSFAANYQTNITQYFQDVAHDSGLQSNVYSSDPQYYQTIGGTTTHIKYQEAFAGSWQDTILPTVTQCPSVAGGPLCVTDAQIQTEVRHAIHVNGWPVGNSLLNEYFVFLADGVSTCTDTTGAYCAFSYFCAYHGNFAVGAGGTVLYANMPYAGHLLQTCGGGDYPNDPNSDATLNVTSHEANETITDPLLNAWYDASGNENGDECAWNFGTPLGGGSGTHYNQVINGHHYELQMEWSNHSGGCVQRGQ